MLQIQIEENEIKRKEISLIGELSIPQSAKKVFEILSQEGPLTSGDIEERCAYSDRTIRNALKRLIRIGLVRKVANFNDMRTSLFHVLNPNAA
ncbi:MAG: MarR family transcriptional regulator [Candidatus Hodarchaeota archaeon]